MRIFIIPAKLVILKKFVIPAKAGIYFLFLQFFLSPLAFADQCEALMEAAIFFSHS